MHNYQPKKDFSSTNCPIVGHLTLYQFKMSLVYHKIHFIPHCTTTLHGDHLTLATPTSCGSHSAILVCDFKIKRHGEKYPHVSSKKVNICMGKNHDHKVNDGCIHLFSIYWAVLLGNLPCKMGTKFTHV